MTLPTDVFLKVAETVFKVVANRDVLDEQGKRGVVSSYGTRLFVFGKEIENLVSFEHSTKYPSPGAVAETTVTLTIVGSNVVTEFNEDKLDVA